MIAHICSQWIQLRPWQLSVFGFALAWWLLLAPFALRWLCHAMVGMAWPPTLNWLPLISYLLLALGAILSLMDLSDKRPPRSRIVAVYFLLGLLCAGIVGTLGWIPVWP